MITLQNHHKGMLEFTVSFSGNLNRNKPRSIIRVGVVTQFNIARVDRLQYSKSCIVNPATITSLANGSPRGKANYDEKINVIAT